MPTLWSETDPTPKTKLKEVKSFSQARAELVDADQVWRSKYASHYCDALLSLASQGYSVRAFSAKIGVALSTVYKWAQEIEEFNEAMQLADARRALFYEETALQNLQNKDFNVKLFESVARATAAPSFQAPGQVGASEPMRNVADPSQMTASERKQRIQQLQKKIEN